MILDREEEAKRIMMGGASGSGYAGGPGGDRDYYGGPPGGMGMGGPGYDMGGPSMGGGPSGGEMMGEIQPKARKMAAAKK